MKLIVLFKNALDPPQLGSDFIQSMLLRVLSCGYEPLVASLPLVAMPFAPSSFLLLVVWPGAPSSVLAPSSDALCS